MNDKDHRETDPDDRARASDDRVGEKVDVLKKTFGLAPETARMTAEDSDASGMRNPASDDVEADRIAAAKATEKD